MEGPDRALCRFTHQVVHDTQRPKRVDSCPDSRMAGLPRGEGWPAWSVGAVGLSHRLDARLGALVERRPSARRQIDHHDPGAACGRSPSPRRGSRRRTPARGPGWHPRCASRLSSRRTRPGAPAGCRPPSRPAGKPVQASLAPSARQLGTTAKPDVCRLPPPYAATVFSPPVATVPTRQAGVVGRLAVAAAEGEPGAVGRPGHRVVGAEPVAERARRRRLRGGRRARPAGPRSRQSAGKTTWALRAGRGGRDLVDARAAGAGQRGERDRLAVRRPGRAGRGAGGQAALGGAVGLHGPQLAGLEQGDQRPSGEKRGREQPPPVVSFVSVAPLLTYTSPLRT